MRKYWSKILNVFFFFVFQSVAKIKWQKKKRENLFPSFGVDAAAGFGKI